MLNRLKSLKSNQEFMKYLSNTSWLFFYKIFKMGLGFFVIIYLTRYLGPERFGVLSYAQSFVSIFMAFSSLGISQVLIRDMINRSDKINSLLGTAFTMTFFSSIMSIIMIFITKTIISSDVLSNKIVFILSFTMIFQNFNIIIDSYFQHKVLSKKIVYMNTIQFILSSSIKFLLIYIKANLIYFAYALLFDVIILSLLFSYAYHRETESILLWSFDFSIAKKYLKVSIPLTIMTVSSFIYTRIDQIMIKYMLDNEAVGNYAAAIRVSELFYFIPGIIVTSLFPKMVEIKKVSNIQYFNLIEKMYRLTIWLAIPIAIGMYIFSDEIVNILYGEQYSQTSTILKILSWGIIFASISAVFVKILYIEHFEKKYMYKNLLGVIINSVLNYFLILKYGVNGAAIATLFTLFAINYLYDLFDKDLRSFYKLKLVCFIPKLKGKQ